METPLKLARERRKLTRKEVAKAVGMDDSHYRRVENGEVGISAEKAEALAKFFYPELDEKEILYPERYAKALTQPSAPAIEA